jgi:hypothetical protein
VHKSVAFSERGALIGFEIRNRVRFGSPGLGYTSATRYLKSAGGQDGMNVPPAVQDEDSGFVLPDDYVLVTIDRGDV